MRSVGGAIRYALRLLRRSPGFTAISILTLGLGIGASTTIYTIVHAVLVAPLPYPEPGRLVHLWQVDPAGTQSNFSDPNYQDVRAQARSFSFVAQYSATQSSVMAGATPVRAGIALVSSDFASVLGVSPARGRWFAVEEQRVGGPRTAIVSHAFWRDALGSASELSRVAITYDGDSYAVVGVLDPETRFALMPADIWIPRELLPVSPARTGHNWKVIARLADGVPIATARAEMRTIAARLRQQHGEGTWMVDGAVVPLKDEIVGPARMGLLVLLGGAVFLLFVACVNAVNLLLTRATARRREMAVRAALGAGRSSLLTLFIAEALLIAIGGAAAGVAIAAVAVPAWLALEPQGIPRLDEIRVGAPALAAAALAAVATALVMGLTAGLRITRLEAAEGLGDDGRSAGAARGTVRARGSLVVLQVATSVVLLVGAGLLARSVAHLLSQSPGFRTEHVMTMELASPRPEDERTSERLAALHEQLLERLSAVPGMIAVGGVNAFPLTQRFSNGQFVVLSADAERAVQELVARCGTRAFIRCTQDALELFGRIGADKTRLGEAEFRVASSGYFRVMGIPLMQGRLFDAHDGPGAPHAAVISQSLARSRWPGQDPVGQRIEFGNMDGDLTPFTIVGVVGDIRERGLDAAAGPTFYAHYRQRPGATAGFTVAMHTDLDPAAATARAREIARALAPDVPPRFRTVEEIVGASTADRRLLMTLLAAFAGAAVLLAAIGLYGVVSYTVSQRTREIGVRMALGATHADVRRLVLGQGLRLAAAGVMLGLLASRASSAVLASLLYGISPADVPTYAAVAALLAAVAVLATQVPARRAARLNPITALRAE
jgi:putative ABC transport system permease protein